MVVGEPYSEPKLRVKWSGPRSVIRAFRRGRIALIRFSFISMFLPFREMVAFWVGAELIRPVAATSKAEAHFEFRSTFGAWVEDYRLFRGFHFSSGGSWMKSDFR